jgi:hypothetical protein
MTQLPLQVKRTVDTIVMLLLSPKSANRAELRYN